MSILRKEAFFALFFFIFIFLIEKSNAQLVTPVVAITGTVFNSVTQEPVTVFLVVLDENGKRVNATRSNSAENGYYYIPSLKPGNKYYITINTPNYFKEKFEIKIADTYKYQEISHDFLVTPLEKGVKIPLPVPPFELNKSKLRYGANELLDDFKQTLLNNSEVKFEIISYPDNNSSKEENKKLTEERAKALMQYFIDNGIDESRITITGSASTDPDPNHAPPKGKQAKGKRYIGTTYLKVTAL